MISTGSSKVLVPDRTEHESKFQLTKDTPYLALTGELWGVCCEDLEENWPLYNSTAL